MRPVVCSIGTTDPWNAAGLGLDQRVLWECGTRPVMVVAAVSVQTIDGLLDVMPMDPAAVVAQWNALVQSHVSLAEAGRTLFAAHDPANAIYVVRAGCVKSVTIDDEGNERVRGFHLPGDLVGLDALGTERYPASAVAVVPSQVCRVPKSLVMQKLIDSRPKPALASSS